jgi:hypothetical protein
MGIQTYKITPPFKKLAVLFTLFLLLVSHSAALAQNYSFEVPELYIDVYWNEDGTSSLDYYFLFKNDSGASPIDFVDVGVPNENYDLGSVYAEVNGVALSDIEASPYVKPGVAVGLGSNAIQPGESGRVRVYIARVNDVLYPDDQDQGYASGVFGNSFFGSDFTHGTTDMTVTFHLPPGVQPDEPRWHSAPSGFPAQPETGLDDKGRVTYTWHNPQASPSKQYTFGSSFPSSYVPESAIVRPPSFNWGGLLASLFWPFLCIGIVILGIFISLRNNRRRKLAYLPPKVTIEGHGIKRGLTAVEAAILMEQPLDKLLTMILFGVLKKNAAHVTKQDPLEVVAEQPLPEGLNPYEEQFLAAFKLPVGTKRRKEMQDMVVALVRSVGEKMKGFSRKETIAYYQDIIKRAWNEVQAANTPEVQAEKLGELMEWTMLDKDYEDRSKDVFRQGPVYVPVWWPRYDPTFGRPSPSPSTKPASLPTPVGGSRPSLPTLPGAEFAASVVGGIQNFSSNVVGNITEFTGGITRVTNPPPPPPPSSSGSRRSSGGGGSSCVCACACACAGCACACAGGGR